MTKHRPKQKSAGASVPRDYGRRCFAPTELRPYGVPPRLRNGRRLTPWAANSALRRHVPGWAGLRPSFRTSEHVITSGSTRRRPCGGEVGHGTFVTLDPEATLFSAFPRRFGKGRMRVRPEEECRKRKQP